MGAWGLKERLKSPPNHPLVHLQLVETYLGKPGLVRETSRMGTLGSALHFLRRVTNSMGEFYRSKADTTPAAGECWSAGRATSGRTEVVRAFQDVVLTPDLKEQVLPRVEV